MNAVKTLFPGLLLFLAHIPGPVPAASTTFYTSSAVPVITLASEPLAESSFKPYGQVIDVPEALKPTVESAVLKYWGGLAKARVHEEIEFGLFTVKPREKAVAEMEKHARTPEFLVGLSGDFILVVAPPGSTPDVLKVKAFRVRSGQAVVMGKGTWHALPFPAGEEGLFLVGFRDGTAKRDLKLKTFRKSALVKFR